MIVEKYTNITALKNKALELVNDNRYCHLRIKGLQQKTISGKSYTVKQGSVTVTDASFNGIKATTDIILTPQNINNNTPYIQFMGYNYTCSLNASPTLKYFDIYGSSDGLSAQEWSEALAALISGGYITVDLCYI